MYEYFILVYIKIVTMLADADERSKLYFKFVSFLCYPMSFKEICYEKQGRNKLDPKKVPNSLDILKKIPNF